MAYIENIFRILKKIEESIYNSTQEEILLAILAPLCLSVDMLRKQSIGLSLSFHRVKHKAKHAIFTSCNPFSLCMLCSVFCSSSIPYEKFEDERGSTSEEVKIEPMISFDCAYRSSTQKGFRCHRVTVHKIGVEVRRTLNTHERPLTYFGGGLDYMFSHINHCLDTIKCTYIPALKWLLGLQVWSYQSLLFSGCLDNKFSSISHCLDIVKSTYSAVLQWLLGLQVWSYQSLLFSGCLD
ncbi:uncharacterized protein TNIN_269741 [Trichonephila inaurata madagascariensis]|uniref:Uncharacterized protein n=1 Tax=Trichonephila inaurata madagascariensis TaxID=2747483 RepID=A0A8X7BWX2_9ARAC|nr:uncharacterized protein TNIN_269741 [Trichonephila inaurata madagascariensis]